MRNMGDSFKKESRYEIRIAGSGGQGIILAGIILAEAAISEGKFAAHSQNYGPEARGGTSVSEVVLSGDEIDYPQAVKLDLLLALTQTACDRNLPDMKPEGLVIVDSELVKRILWGKVVRLPFLRMAQERGRERAINMAALGALAAFCPLISRRSLRRAIIKKLSSEKVEVNLLAFDEGLKLARRLRKSLKFVETSEEFEI